MKKISLLLLAFAMMFTITSCGSKHSRTNYYFRNSSDGKSIIQDLDNVTDSLSPSEVYAEIQYNEKMFYGAYLLNDMKKDIKTFNKKSSFVMRTLVTDAVANQNGIASEKEVSLLPIGVTAGFNGVCSAANTYAFHAFSYNREQEWAVLLFSDTSGNIIKAICTYEVEGNKIRFTPLSGFEVIEDGDNKELDYTLGNEPIEYEFTFNAFKLTLKSRSESVELISYPFTNNTSAKELEFSSCAAKGSPLVNGIDNFVGFGEWITNAYNRGGEKYKRFAMKLRSDGLMTFIWEEETETGETVTQSRQFACFVVGCNSFSAQMILSDGEQTYYYYETTSSRERLLLEGRGENLSDQEIEQLVEKRNNLLDDLSQELSDAGIKVVVDQSSGDISLDSEVLFAGDSSKISDDGKKILKQFMEIYTSIVYNEKYDGLIAQTLIEGHTAPLSDSTYESGLPLSKERAENVRKYCLSVKTLVDENILKSDLKAIGRSNSQPVYDNDGNIDLASCRRVSFRLIVNTETQDS